MDEEWLIGDVEGRDNERGEAREGFGRLLAAPEGRQFWFENAIEGVTDGLGGERVMKH